MSPHPTHHRAHRIRAIISLILATAALLLAMQVNPPSAAAVRTTPPSQAPHGPSSNVAIVDFAFDPAVVTITAGSSVQWTNTGAFTHTTTSNAAVWDSGPLGPGGVFSKTLDLPGDYDYHCAIHFSMHGRIVVLTNVYLPLLGKG